MQRRLQAGGFCDADREGPVRRERIEVMQSPLHARRSSLPAFHFESEPLSTPDTI